MSLLYVLVYRKEKNAMFIHNVIYTFQVSYEKPPLLFVLVRFLVERKQRVIEVYSNGYTSI